jgi:hypothetical protein
MGNQEKSAYKTKTNLKQIHNTTCVGHHYSESSTNNVNKT